MISIDPTRATDAKLDTDSMTVTPAYRSGGLVQFPVKRAIGGNGTAGCRNGSRCRPAPR